MGHPYPLREIARQAGVSEATVDRVLNGRGGVRPSTVLTVRQAIDDLDRQRTQVRLTGRTFLIDVVMQAPARFTSAVRRALEAELPALRPAVFRARFHLRETAPVAEIVALLDGIRRRGSKGVLLKAPDVPEVAEAAQRLVAAGIPVVTLVTDGPASGRLAYVGIDNRSHRTSLAADRRPTRGDCAPRAATAHPGRRLRTPLAPCEVSVRGAQSGWEGLGAPLGLTAHPAWRLRTPRGRCARGRRGAEWVDGVRSRPPSVAAPNFKRFSTLTW